jgi:hypothetical protein
LLVFYILAILTSLIWLVVILLRPTAFRRTVAGWCAIAVLAGLLVTSAGLVTGCNGGQVATTTGATGVTSSATYAISINGASGSDSHTFILDLTVQ